ncbi:sugar transferase [Parabacteroides distasonis]|jgi:undecaprenyl phosphate N,N'-diacetylbacillosamine 1-phosphate transferase
MMYRNAIKRLMDFSVSAFAMPILVPLIAAVAIGIKLDDGGPIFHRGERMGKDGRIFRMFKFRSMKVNSPDLRNADGSTFNGDTDPRVTRIGKILRKTSIDEIPQLINVLLGDMSLIGPRPSLTTTPYSQYNDIRKKRVSVRPGVTGYSQAYFRNSITQEEKFKYDCDYVDNITFTGDVKILKRTILSVLKRDNIYVKQ